MSSVPQPRSVQASADARQKIVDAARRVYEQHHAVIEALALEDVFEMAGLYAEAIARGHAFVDANKRTALVSALTYLLLEGFIIARAPALEEIMVDVAEGRLDYLDIANIFSTLAIPLNPIP